MLKANLKIFSSFLIYGALALTTTAGISTAAESEFFDQKDENFWVVKNKKAFIEAAATLIDDEGNWKGRPPAPQYIKYSHELTKDDLPYLERWLSLKELTCFAVADQNAQPNLRLINSWYSDLVEKGENLEQKNLYKLAWLNFKTTLNEIERGEQSLLPSEWVETNRAYQIKNSHYYVVETH